MPKMMKVAIIGGGVNGFGCACQVIEKFPTFQITLIAKAFSPETTSDGAAGLWMPYLVEETPPHKIMQWGCETYRYFHSLWLQGNKGVCLIPVFTMYRNNEPFTVPLWANEVFGTRIISKEELQFWSKQYSTDYTGGISYVTFTCEPTILLPFLMETFKSKGGQIIKSEVQSLEDIACLDYDVIINCSGLGAKDIVPDHKVIAIRGQIIRVNAPWQFHILLDKTEGGHYIIPNTNSVVLGGTSQKGNYSRVVDPKDTAFIHNGCKNIIPGLENAPIIMEWAGLRPSRLSVRLEREDVLVTNKTAAKRRKVRIIHNYGHGGSGITLFWGCAEEVVGLLQQAYKELQFDQSGHITSSL